MAYDGAIAARVLRDKTDDIKQACLDIPTLCNKLSYKEIIITYTQETAITDFRNFKDGIAKMEEIIRLVVASVGGNGSNFNVFLEALRTGQAKRGKDLADKLNTYYHQLVAQGKVIHVCITSYTLSH